VSDARRQTKASKEAQNFETTEHSLAILPLLLCTTKKKNHRHPYTATDHGFCNDILPVHNRPGIQDPQHLFSNSPFPSSFSSGYFSVLHKVHTPLSASAKCTHPLSAPRLRVDICVTSKKLGCPSSAATLGGCDRVLVGLQNALLDELIRFWPILELLLQAVGPHMLLEVFLVALKGWCGSAVGEDVAIN